MIETAGTYRKAAYGASSGGPGSAFNVATTPPLPFASRPYRRASTELIEAKIHDLGSRLSEYPHHRLRGRSEYRLRAGDYRVPDPQANRTYEPAYHYLQRLIAMTV